MTIKPRVLGHSIAGLGLAVALGALLWGWAIEFDKGHSAREIIVNIILPTAGVVIAILAQGYTAVEALTRAEEQQSEFARKSQQGTAALDARIQTAIAHVQKLDAKVVDRFEAGDVLLETLGIRAEILDRGDHVATLQCKRMFTRLRNQLRELKNGHFAEHDPKNFYDFVTSILAQAETSLVATSVVRDDFWTRPAGERYLSENAQMVLRGVKITRYFVFKKSEGAAQLASFMPIVVRQRESGITAHVVILDEAVKPEMEAFRDLGIVDDRLAIFDSLDQDSGEITKCDCYFELPAGSLQFDEAKGIIIKLDRHKTSD